MDLRKHYKLYKSGKQWCVMALATLASVIGVATAVSANTTVTSTNEINDSTQINTISNVNSNSTPNEKQATQDQSASIAQNSQAREAVLKDSQSATQSAELSSSAAVSGNVNSAQNANAEPAQNSSNEVAQSNAASATTDSASTATTQVKLAAANTEKNGWVPENNHLTYYDHGNIKEGRSYSYLPTINGQGYSWYLVDNGVVQSGVQKWAGTYYYFDPTTHLRVDNNYVQSQWGMWYMFGPDGRIATRVYQWAGTYYYFDPVTYLRVDNDYRQSQWGMWYMFGHDGRIATKVYQWANSYYYFDPVTYLRVDNDYRQSQWGDWYLFGNDGRILSGLQKWVGCYYYFDPSTYLKLTNTNFEFAGMALYADASGIISGQNRNSSFLLSIYQASLDGWYQYGVLPSVTAAQAILESAWGESALATEGHNLFGIKGSYNGQSIVMRTAEYGGGGYYYINDAFRRYPSNYESVVDHGRFLAINSRYHNLLWQRNYAVVTNDLRADGYATAPTYASSLNNVIRTYGLDSWDRQVF